VCVESSKSHASNGWQAICFNHCNDCVTLCADAAPDVPSGENTLVAANVLPQRQAVDKPLPRSLPAAGNWALFIDLDGTLCPFRDDPSKVELDEAQRAVLGVLQQRLDGAICVISGRTAEDLQRLLEGLEIERIGDHGHDRDARVPEGFPDALAQGC
jgi:hypothetical protein